MGISSWARGESLHPLILYDSIKVGTIICIESIHPYHIRNLTLQGANIFVVITNDSWYDFTAGPMQHYIISAVRAIEMRRYIARCANSGVSGIISPTGKTLLQAPQYQKATISFDVPLIDENYFTLYAKIGDVLPFVSIFIVIFVVLFIRFRKKTT